MSATREPLDVRFLASALIDLFADADELRRWLVGRFDDELAAQLGATILAESTAIVAEWFVQRGRAAELLGALQDEVARGGLAPRVRSGWLSASRGASPAAEPAAEVYLNLWFPASEPREPRLVVGQAVQMCVDLGPRRPAAGPRARPLGAEVLAQLRTVSRVDVWVQCPDADVTPCAGALDLNALGDPLRFKLTPRRAGALRVVVVLLVRNQPIHRIQHELQVWEPEARATRW